jgi:hypothetical protein
MMTERCDALPDTLEPAMENVARHTRPRGLPTIVEPESGRLLSALLVSVLVLCILATLLVSCWMLVRLGYGMWPWKFGV